MPPVSMPLPVAAGCLLVAMAWSAGCDRAEVAVFHAALPAGLERDVVELHALQVIAYEPVEGLSGHRGQPFFVQSRQPSLRQYPCSSCHLEPLPVLPEPDPARTPAMHLDIALNHADEKVMSCTTCHDPDALNQLRHGDLGGIAFNHAYRLCAPCHFQQVEDWAGGAHGKRLAGWAGRRVVMNCTACHDPHAPAIGPQWPVAFPNLPPAIPPNAHLSSPPGADHD